MANDVVNRALGLVLQFNPLDVQPGSLVRADNIVIRRENVIEDRRGYALYGSCTSNISQLMTYMSKTLSHNGGNVAYDNGSGTFTNYAGSYNAPTGQKMRFVEAFGNLYTTTDAGVQVFTDVVGTAARKAGAPRSLDPSYALNAAGSGFLAAGSQCAYRAVILRIDANGNSLYSYPSTRIVAYNTAGTGKNIDLTLYFPAELTSSDVVQFYRTAAVTGTASDTSGDEMALVYQVSPTAGQIAAGFMTFTDSVVDALRGATLYTSPSQLGIQGANERPPLAKDIALYRSSFMFYANTSTKQRQFFSLLGTSGLTGNTLTIAGVTYNFGASEIASGGGSPQAQVGATGVAAADIDSTARSLVRVINRYAGNTSIYAYYLSGSGDLPGQIMVEERGVGAAAFSTVCSNSTIQAMFSASGTNPPISPTTTTQWTSTNQVQKNGLYWSQSQQPEAVPLLNFLPVGPSNEDILRIAPLRESLIIIKSRGVYRLTGLDPSSFVVTPLDLTVNCKSADSVAVLSNQVIMLSQLGVVSISDTGVQVVSREIEPAILPLNAFTNISTLATGCSYESEHSYLLSLPSASSDPSQNQTFVYNIFTKTWVHWTFGFSAAVVELTSDKLFFAKPGAVQCYRERKDFADTDFADPDVAATINTITTATSTVKFTPASGIPLVGWVLSQGSTGLAIQSITNNGDGTFTAVMSGLLPTAWTTGAATLFPAVGAEWIYNAWFGGQEMAGTMKRVSEVAILADNISGNNTASIVLPTFATNLDEVREGPSITSTGGGWGGTWSVIQWGGSGDAYGYRTYVPRNKQYCALMNVGVQHPYAQEKLACVGVAYKFEPVSERIRR
jgi:hypothetical protein